MRYAIVRNLCLCCSCVLKKEEKKEEKKKRKEVQEGEKD